MISIKEHDKIQEKLQILNMPVIIAMENLLLTENQDFPNSAKHHHSSDSFSSVFFIMKQIWTLALYFPLLTETKKKVGKKMDKTCNVLNLEK